ncbi:adenosylcobinamide-phosphate synthase [Stanieria cyanosphaera PCC 7437]|uniref:Cobalamin biosynthesis protein CobD n=1 Tax=Stanieria cyanosphaera (strain ATCC 29371 / PCC 7437) TaxID=111780 RepID=K9XZA2_STAC7|nr:adenosylcobinamide-phosphate synthase CbiB [Stanieria cyanosphaera]AFZ37853.1 adenosylcobinamide-phosphate synthase [Stanieria cyanosphaera PCC 7437]
MLSPEQVFLVLLLAAIWDYLIGDPRSWLHPVQVMGWIITKFTKLILNLYQQPRQLRLQGILLSLLLIFGSGVFGWLIVWGSNLINFWLGIVIATVVLASCFAGKSLTLAAEDVLQALVEGDLKTARFRLSFYVGRDTDNLSESEILRAILETVAENTVDGVTAPLFYAILGAFLPGVGSVPLVLGYKAASTLDSMIGYRHEPYTDLGWFSAQLEDRLTWVPCRLTVLTLALCSGKPKQVLALCCRDAVKDPSPNSGWSESIYAAILGVQLGGVNTYQGIVKQKPLLGEAIHSITPETVKQALGLTRWCFLLWLAIALGCAIIVYNFNLSLN